MDEIFITVQTIPLFVRYTVQENDFGGQDIELHEVTIEDSQHQLRFVIRDEYLDDIETEIREAIK